MTTVTTQPSTTSANWAIDPVHSNVSFSVRHLMITNVRGEFQKVSGAVTFDPARPEKTQVAATIDAASVNTHEAQRDTHLKSADFLDVEKYPTLDFISRTVKPLGKGRLEITGDLTLHGTTRPVTLEVEGPTSEQKDPWGNQRVGASVKTKIRRSDFGVTYNSVLEAGGVALSDEVSIQIDVSLVKQK